jgi:hypothetical protein
MSNQCGEKMKNTRIDEAKRLLAAASPSLRGFILRKDNKHPGRVESLMKKHGLDTVNQPKATPNHPKKSHIVMAKEGEEYKLIRFGEQGAKTKPPSKGESKADRAKRKSFKARHSENIAKGKKSAAYWADRTKW